MEDPLLRLDEHESWRLGVAAGALDQVVGQPLLYWKNAFQQGMPFSANPAHLYRGTLASVCNMAVTTGLQSTTYGFFQKSFNMGRPPAETCGGAASSQQQVGAAFLGGMASGPVCGFIELVMIQQQRFGGSILGTPCRIFRDFGVTGLGRGLLLTSGREGLFTAGYLGVVPVTQRKFSEYLGADSKLGNVLGSLGGGLLCGFISQPLDTAKTCMQGDLERKRYGSIIPTIRTLVSEYGSVKALYRGFWWRTAIIALDFFLLDTLLRGLAPVMFPAKCSAPLLFDQGRDMSE